MNIVFLDFDGCLNSTNNPIREPNWKFAGSYTFLDEILVKRLNRLIEATEAKIVISSSWRTEFSLEELQEFLIRKGLIADVIDITPILPRRFSETKDSKKPLEIRTWLDDHPGEIKRYVIFDDWSGFLNFDKLSRHFIYVDEIIGITEKNIDQAITIFSGQIVA